MHWKLRRALKDIVIETFSVPPSDVSDFDITKIRVECRYRITMRPGVAVTKWHRLARLKALAELKLYYKGLADSMAKYMEEQFLQRYEQKKPN